MFFVHFQRKSMIVALLYLALAGAYLLVIPVVVMVYLKQRWYVATSIERTIMYFMVFFFLPGLLLLSPFVNLRPRPRQIEV
ncbi:NAD(P)H-quinone oxidoreductase subunit L [Chrysosporum bergii ANA360D]|uniref:NAD(P)H-quinone oxidoreductase subunit L n=1 Tax=Chrysosporum bergii ANA360D TaxID=617107 RepID=A0AA43KCV3_9CYAN|nr:NAD(P)H-quinone oxidoreductase subunit L [Chrysosporum bergii]MDH6061228.1 NAD(P)H-quinone oxidoreductase subunit L [Chrysosporum bergii ANA360D]